MFELSGFGTGVDCTCLLLHLLLRVACTLMDLSCALVHSCRNVAYAILVASFWCSSACAELLFFTWWKVAQRAFTNLYLFAIAATADNLTLPGILDLLCDILIIHIMAIIREEQMAQIETVGAAMGFVRMDAAGPCGKALLAALGAQGDTPVTLLATIPDSIWDEAISAIQYRRGEQDQKPTPLERGQMAMMRQLAFKISGLAPPLTAGSSAMSPSTALATLVPSSTVQRKVKLSTILSQTDDTEIVIEGTNKLQYQARWKAVFGAKSKPREEDEVTEAQMQAVEHLLAIKVNPFLDFAVWGPY